MLKELDYKKFDVSNYDYVYGKGAELGMGIIAAFAVIAIVTVVIYKVFSSKTGDITLPGGFKFKFST